MSWSWVIRMMNSSTSRLSPTDRAISSLVVQGCLGTHGPFRLRRCLKIHTKQLGDKAQLPALMRQDSRHVITPTREMAMTGFRVGITDGIVVSRPRAETFTRANYLNALANRADSFWVPDHLNGIGPAFVVEAKVFRRNEACANA